MLRTSISALALLLLCCSSNAQNQNIFFVPPTYHFTGFNPIAADLNGDGKADLVSTVGTVLLGNADGTLHTGTPWSINGQVPYPDVIAVADFNGDGKPDLLVTAQNYFYVLLGIGDGTFQAPLTTTTGVSAGFPVFVTDVNGDGKPDIILAATIGLVYLGNGDGTFTLEPKNPVIVGNVLGIGDFNRDGKVDILLAPATGQVGVLLGNGDGTFQTSLVTTTVPELQSAQGPAAIADLNGDQIPDVVISDGVSPLTFVLLGIGDGPFSSTQFATPAFSRFAVADINGDGKLICSE